MSQYSYKIAIRAAVRELFNKKTTIFYFSTSMSSLIAKELRQAWYDGANKCGILPTELSQEELFVLSNEIRTQIQYIVGFGVDIAVAKKLPPLLKRADMWANRYSAVIGVAQSYACKDAKLRWISGDSEKKCPDCNKLSGRIYRASVWQKYGIAPGSKLLACKGFRCSCGFEKTDKRVTPGRPPALSRNI